MLQLVSFKAWNAKVPAQMQQIDRAEVAGDGNQRYGLRSFGQNDCTTHVYAVHDHPYIGCTVVHRTTISLGGDEVFPAAQVIGFANSIYRGFVGNSHSAEAEQVNADSVE